MTLDLRQLRSAVTALRGGSREAFALLHGLTQGNTPCSSWQMMVAVTSSYSEAREPFPRAALRAALLRLPPALPFEFPRAIVASRSAQIRTPAPGRGGQRFRGPNKQRRCACSAPSAATCSSHRWCRATSEVPKTNNAHPEWRRVLQVSGSAAPAGPVVRQNDPQNLLEPHSECARSPEQKCRALRSRPQGLRDRARHQSRSASRGVAGCPRRRGSRRQHSGSGSGSGEGFPPIKTSMKEEQRFVANLKRLVVLTPCLQGISPSLL